MNYIKPHIHINKNEYDHIISIGNKCPTTMILKELNLYKESFPFDSIPTTPSLILKYLKNTNDFFPKYNKIRSDDNVWFGHFNLTDKYDDTILTFKKRFNRLFKLLENKERILFVYTSEADIYNELNNQFNDNYTELCNIIKYIEITYNYNNFKILAIHTNKSFIDTTCLINYTINVPKEYLSNDMSTHTKIVTSKYREVLKVLIKEIFLIK